MHFWFGRHSSKKGRMSLGNKLRKTLTATTDNGIICHKMTSSHATECAAPWGATTTKIFSILKEYYLPWIHSIETGYDESHLVS